MTCLHTISKAPSSGLLETCSSTLKKGDGIVFIEDGVYYCLNNSLCTLNNMELEIFGLKEDLSARGLINRSHKEAEIIGYDRFVDLCCHYDKVVNWF